MDQPFSEVQMVREGNGPPLVLLHCLGVDHRFWDFAVPLADDFTLYRFHGLAVCYGPPLLHGEGHR